MKILRPWECMLLSLFFLFFCHIFLIFLTLQYCIGFAMYQNESATGIHVFPILNPPPSSLPVPFLWVVPVHQPQASSIVHQTWTGDSFHIWYYTCFNAILPNHPTLSLSHRVQKTVLLSHQPRCSACSSKARINSVQFSLVWLFVTPWTVALQASLSITNSRSLLKLMSIESVMPSNHLILCHPLLLSPSIFPSIRVFSNESALRIRWPKHWSFSFNISPSKEHSGLISFRMDWLDLLGKDHMDPKLWRWVFYQGMAGSVGLGNREACLQALELSFVKTPNFGHLT